MRFQDLFQALRAARAAGVPSGDRLAALDAACTLADRHADLGLEDDVAAAFEDLDGLCASLPEIGDGLRVLGPLAAGVAAQQRRRHEEEEEEEADDSEAEDGEEDGEGGEGEDEDDTAYDTSDGGSDGDDGDDEGGGPGLLRRVERAVDGMRGWLVFGAVLNVFAVVVSSAALSAVLSTPSAPSA